MMLKREKKEDALDTLNRGFFGGELSVQAKPLFKKLKTFEFLYNNKNEAIW